MNNSRLVEVTGVHAVSNSSLVIEGGRAYKLVMRTPDEHFLAERRRSRTNHYERNLPGDGLLIWHVRNRNVGNSLEREKRVNLVCADGLYKDGGGSEGRVADPLTGGDNFDFWSHDGGYATAHAGNLGDVTDLFDGVHYTEFSPSSNPPTMSGITIFNIRRDGGLLSADLQHDTCQRSGVISGDEIWRDSIIVVGDVLVSHQTRLTIVPGAVVSCDTDNDDGGLNADRHELIVGGESGRPVVSTSAARMPERGDWHGIVVHFQGTIDMRNTLIEYT